MITDEKILELVITITAKYGQLGSDALVPIVRNWLKENGLINKETKQGE